MLTEEEALCSTCGKELHREGPGRLWRDPNGGAMCFEIVDNLFSVNRYLCHKPLRPED